MWQHLNIDTNDILDAIEAHKKYEGDHSVEQAFLMISEEVGELLTAISHFRRGRIEADKLLEEAADVLLLLRLLVRLFDSEQFVSEQLKYKAIRVIGRFNQTPF